MKAIWLISCTLFLCLLTASAQATPGWHLTGYGLPQGTPSHIAIIDTGFDPNAQWRGQVTLKHGQPNTNAGAHGNLILASIIGSGGAAPTGTIVDAYDCSDGASVELVCALNALDEAVGGGARVVNMSFTRNESVPDWFVQQWAEHVATARAAGVTVIASAGNGERAGFPASVAGVVSVGAKSESGQLTSAAGDVNFPGEALPIQDKAGQWITVSGPSFASAFATAAASIYGEAALSPACSWPQQATCALQGAPSSAHSLAAPVGLRAQWRRHNGALSVSWRSASGACGYRIKIRHRVYRRAAHIRTLRMRTRGLRTIQVRSIGCNGQASPWRARRVAISQ